MRKLAAAALAFSAAVFAANYILPTAWPPVFAIALAVGGAVLTAFHRKWLRGFVIVSIAAAVGFGLFFIHAQRTTVKARELDGTSRELTVRLLDYPQVYDSYCRASVRVEGEGLPRLNALLYDSDMWIAGAEPGQLLRFTGSLKAADTKYGEDYDYYNSRDIYLTINARSAVAVVDRGFDLRTIPARLHHFLAQLAERVFPQDVSAYMKALMLGDKSGLYEDPGMKLALTRAGFMQVVAVSGMHIAYLVTLLQLLLGKNRRSSLLCIGLVWLFVLTTGASPSAVRAGIMQSFLLFAPVVKRENDPLTSLSTALALILLWNPYAAASVSLQLSFSSMAGLMCFSDWFRALLHIPLPAGRLGRVLRSFLDVAVTSLSALVFTLPLAAIHFGYAAILSPLTGILAMWTVPICFCGAYISCAFGAIIPALGSLAGWLVAWPARFLLLVARLSSAIPFSLVYMQNELGLLWLIFCYAAFIILALCRVNRWLKLLIPTALSAAALFLVLSLTRASYERLPGVISVLDVGEGQCITAFAGERTLMIDCGGQWTLDNAGETAGAYLRACGRERVDLLLLSHLHEDHVNGVPLLLEMLPVEQIILPVPEDRELPAFDEIRKTAAAHGTQLLVFQNDLVFRLDDVSIALFAPTENIDADANERCIMAKVSLGSYDMLVTGDSPAAEEEALLARQTITGAELLIVGHHGSKTSSGEELLGSIGADTAVISCGYNRYGHPDQETLERLARYGYNVYRTDRDGTIVIRVGQEYGETN